MRFYMYYMSNLSVVDAITRNDADGVEYADMEKQETLIDCHAFYGLDTIRFLRFSSYNRDKALHVIELVC